MSRIQLLLLWLLCTIFMPVLSVAMFCQALFGSEERAKSMAIAQDACGNALFGGKLPQTMSERTGNALIEGAKWAKIAAKVIDFFFGKGHCLANASIPIPPGFDS
jgi:hypothetical protein